MPYDNAHHHLGKALMDLLESGRLASSRQRQWASATFTGARHNFTVEADVPPIKLDTLDSHEFKLPGHIVADICVVGYTSGSSGCAVEVEALTVEDC